MSIGSFITTVENDIVKWAKEAEDVADAILDDVWGGIKAVVFALDPALLAEFKTLVKDLVEVEQMVLADLADFETALLNKASPALQGALQGLGSQVTQALIVLIGHLHL